MVSIRYMDKSRETEAKRSTRIMTAVIDRYVSRPLMFER